MVDTQIDEVLQETVSKHEWLTRHWDDGIAGWPGREATLLLQRNRLDRLLELARALSLWKDHEAYSEGHLILAWANLGALVEGTMKWFLCAFASTYGREPVVKRNKAVDPDRLSFDEIREYFRKTGAWLNGTEQQMNAFVEHIQHRRNAIHAYQDREIGSFDEFWDSVRKYSDLLADLAQRPPLPWDTDS